MPIFEEYDELSHVLFVRHLQAYQTLPIQTTDTETARAHHPPGYYILGAWLTGWIQVPGATDKLYLEPNPYFRIEVGDHDSDNKLRWVHYTPDERWPYAGLPLLVHVLRVLSAVFSTLAVWWTYLAARHVRPNDETFALLTAALLAFIPEVTFNAGLVYNDTAALAGAAATLYILSRCERSGWTTWRWVMVGAVFAVGLMFKLSLLALGPAVALLWLVDAIRGASLKRGMLNALALAGPVLLFTGWWFWRNKILYGDWTANAVIIQMWGTPPSRSAWFYLRDLLRDPLGRFGTGEWASFPGWAYWAANALAGLSLASTVWAGGRWLVQARARIDKLSTWPLWVMHGLTISVVLASVLSYAIQVVGFAQTRYLFPGYPSLALLLVAGFLRLWRGHIRTGAAWALGVVGFALSAYALFGIVLPVFGPPRFPSAQELRQIEPLEARIGEVVEVMGYRWRTEPTPEGVALTVDIYWKPLARTSTPYTVFIHIFDSEVGSLAQRDTYPGGGNWATTIWDPQQPFVDTFHLRLRADQLPVSNGQILLGLYDRQTLERLPVSGPNTSLTDNWVMFGPVEITASNAP